MLRKPDRKPTPHPRLRDENRASNAANRGASIRSGSAMPVDSSGHILSGLRVNSVAAHPGMSEMTWDNDKRATLELWRGTDRRTAFIPTPGP
jgi:hypothetical protein